MMSAIYTHTYLISSSFKKANPSENWSDYIHNIIQLSFEFFFNDLHFIDFFYNEVQKICNVQILIKQRWEWEEKDIRGGKLGWHAHCYVLYLHRNYLSLNMIL